LQIANKIGHRIDLKIPDFCVRGVHFLDICEDMPDGRFVWPDMMLFWVSLALLHHLG